VHDALQASVLAEPVIGADETHWKLLGYKNTGGKTKRWQVWAITSRGAVCYRIKAGRSVEEAADVLGDYRGIVMCDGYAVYSSLHKQRRAMRLANCWAHYLESGIILKWLSLPVKSGRIDAQSKQQLRIILHFKAMRETPKASELAANWRMICDPSQLSPRTLEALCASY
jgi:hypothetical protein